MSETPRTDAHQIVLPTWRPDVIEITNTVPIEFARTLERELTAERAHANRLAALLTSGYQMGALGRTICQNGIDEALTAHEARRKGGTQ